MIVGDSESALVVSSGSGGKRTRSVDYHVDFNAAVIYIKYIPEMI